MQPISFNKAFTSTRSLTGDHSRLPDLYSPSNVFSCREEQPQPIKIEQKGNIIFRVLSRFINRLDERGNRRHKEFVEELMDPGNKKHGGIEIRMMRAALRKL